MTSLPGLLSLGFLLGLKHAFDADHLAAVASLMGRGAGFRRASAVGALWGLGHTAALFVLALILVLFKIPISPELARVFELLVGLMLGGLALNLLWHVLRGDTLHLHAHRHGTVIHSHPHFHAHEDTALVDHHSGWTRVRPFLVGLVHGTAGSAALMLLVAASAPGPLHALLFVLVFGAGSIGGMLVTSAVLMLPLAAAARRSTELFRAVQAVVALATLVLSVRIVMTFLSAGVIS